MTLKNLLFIHDCAKCNHAFWSWWCRIFCGLRTIKEETYQLKRKKVEENSNCAGWIYKSNVEVDWDKILKEAAKKKDE